VRPPHISKAEVVEHSKRVQKGAETAQPQRLPDSAVATASHEPFEGAESITPMGQPLSENANFDALEKLRLRSGADCSLLEFTAAVCDAYNDAKNISEAEIVRRYQWNGSQDFLHAALKAIKPILRDPHEIVFVGCSHGIGGRRAAHIPAVIGEMPQWNSAQVTLIDVTAQSLADGLPELNSRPPIEVLITHSFVHYLLDPSFFLETVARRLAPGGAYVMAQEPNRRFFQDLKALNPSQPEEGFSLLQKLSSLKFLPRRRSTADVVNQKLRQAVGLKRDLTIEEMQAIVDPHGPTHTGQPRPYGVQGLDWDELKATFFRGFELPWVSSHGRQVEEQGGARSEDPLRSGPLFSAAWKKPASA
jgi:hypothetical protein